jgi:hypothetical protein
MTKNSQTWLQKFPWLGYQETDPYVFEVFLHKAANVQNYRGDIYENLIFDIWAPISLSTPGSVQALTLGEMFPLLPKSLDLASIDNSLLRNGYKNKLLHAGYLKWGQIADLQPYELTNLRNLGQKIYVSLMQAFLLLSLSESFVAETNEDIESLRSAEPEGSSQRDLAGAFEFDFRSGSQAEFTAQLNRVMVLAKEMGLGDETLTQLFANEDFLAVHESTLFLTTSNKWLEGILIPSIKDVLEEWVLSLDSNLKTVLIGRFAPKSTTTLDELGTKLMLSRERVRQLEVKLRKEFLNFSSRNPLATMHLNIFSVLVGELSSERRLLKNYSYLKTVVGPKGLRIIDVFCAASENIRNQDSWLSSFTTKQLNKKLVTILEPFSKTEGTITYLSVANALSTAWVKLDDKDVSILIANAGWTNFMGHLLRPREVGMQDYAYVVLSVNKEPMTPEEILLKIGKERTLTSLKNALATDQRFDRVTKNDYGLRSWGLPSYSNISDMIVKYIEENGSVALSSLEKLFSSTYNVSVKSIRVYASTFPLEIVGGIVSKTSVRPVIRKPIADTKNVYMANDRVLLRLTVTDEHLRGSGVPVSAVFASCLGVDFGDAKKYRYSAGHLKLSRPKNTAQLSSIRSICSELELQEGDQVFLSFGAANVTFWKILISLENPEYSLKNMLGLPQVLDRPLGELIRERLGLPNTVSKTELLAKVGDKRKEMDVYAILQNNPQFMD